MTNRRQIVTWLTLWLLVSLSPTHAAEGPFTVNVPPSAELLYTVKAQYNGLDLAGNAFIRWKNSQRAYSLQNETRITPLGKILNVYSQGEIGPTGLKPEKYTEKRLGKPQVVSVFDYAKNSMTLPSGQTVPLKETVQDRASIVWQLAAVARANPERFTLGSTWTFPVAGNSKIELWTFNVVKIGILSTPMGDVKTVQLFQNSKDDQEVNVWLASDHDWYPVQIFFIERDGVRIRQTVKKIVPVSSADRLSQISNRKANRRR